MYCVFAILFTSLLVLVIVLKALEVACLQFACDPELMQLFLLQGAPPCMHFARGDCKFGPACKFDHSFGSLSYNPSASSLGDIPITPFPAGFSFGMLYPSYSSPELRAEIISGPTEDSLPTRSSSTTSMSVTSVGSARPSSGPAPAQMPDLSSANPASCNTKDGHSTG